MRIACCFCFLALAQLCAQEPLPDLRSLDLSGWDCLNKIEGSAKTKGAQLRNRVKNRPWIDVGTKPIPEFDTKKFLAETVGYDAELGGVKRDKLDEVQTKRLGDLEQRFVSLTGWLVLYYAGVPESTNCGSADFHDWHLEILPTTLDHPPALNDPTGIVCEITPRTETALFEKGVRLTALAGYMRRGNPPHMEIIPTGHAPHKIRVTGYLMWDDEHSKPALDIGAAIEQGALPNYTHPWRSTAWEIHPILTIEDLGTGESK